MISETLQYCEETSPKVYAIQNISEAMLKALIKALKKELLSGIEYIEIDRLLFELEKPTPLEEKTNSKTKKNTKK